MKEFSIIINVFFGVLSFYGALNAKTKNGIILCSFAAGFYIAVAFALTVKLILES